MDTVENLRDVESSKAEGKISFWERILTEEIYGLRKIALLEILGFLAILTFCDFVFGDGKRFLEVYPHPFWLIVLLSTFQYGASEGMAATLLSAVFLYVFNVPEPHIVETNFDYSLRLSYRLFLWLSVAVVLGELRSRHKNEAKQWQLDLEKSLEREELITQSYEKLRESKDYLEVRIAGQVKSSIASYEAVKSIESLNTSQILKGIGEVIQSVMSPKKFSIYSYGENGFEVIFSQGWEESDQFPTRILDDSKIYQAIVQDRKILCSVRAEDQKILGEDAVLVAPMIDYKKNEIFGLIKVEQIDFLSLNLTNIESFKILSEWAGLAYTQARVHQDVLKDSTLDYDLPCYSFSFLDLQTKYLSGLAKKLGVPAFSAQVKFKNETKLSKVNRAQMSKDFVQSLKVSLKKQELLFSGKRTGELQILFLGETKDEINRRLEEVFESVSQSEELKSVQVQFTLKEL